MKPYWEQDGNKIYQGHVPEILKAMTPESVQCVVTSPPYWGLRDYGLPPMIWDSGHYKFPFCTHVWGDEIKGAGKNNDQTAGEKQRTSAGSIDRDNRSASQFCQLCGAWRGSLGLEPTPELYIQHIVEIFREVERVLRKDGTVWLNLGDSYASVGSGSGQNNSEKAEGNSCDSFRDAKYLNQQNPKTAVSGLKPKDLCGIPWRVALALQADGWWLRQDIIWSKPNPMPESVTDRCTKSHEYLFLLTKSGKYFFDNDAIREPHETNGHIRYPAQEEYASKGRLTPLGKKPRIFYSENGRNKRSVWQIATHPMPDAHFATFPPKLVESCILAGTSEKGCCPECGAPWKRVVEKKISLESGRKSLGLGPKTGGDGLSTHGQGATTLHHESESKTTGWRPTCNCGNEICADINNDCLLNPCTVLDPFFGSGTVGIVAHKHGRNFTGIELSKTYLDDIAIPRIESETAQLKLF